MADFTRYAVYFVPQSGALAGFADSWLGWSARQGVLVRHPDLAGLPLPISDITQKPRKYGFHATLKPPFRLAQGSSQSLLAQDCQGLAATMQAVDLGHLSLARLGRFLALVDPNESAAVNELAAQIVTKLDGHRAPMSSLETEDRLKSARTPRQQDLVGAWGYPHVLDQYRFHMTLTGKLSKDDLSVTQAALEDVLRPMLETPIAIDTISLMGEAEDGMFHVIDSFPLTG